MSPYVSKNITLLNAYSSFVRILCNKTREENISSTKHYQEKNIFRKKTIKQVFRKCNVMSYSSVIALEDKSGKVL